MGRACVILLGMFYQHLQHTSGEVFKRLTDVSKDTFDTMLTVLRDNRANFGRPSKLALEDRLLMTLMYLRAYRTLEHIGATYGVHKSHVLRTVQRFEKILLKDKRFRLPGKKALTQSEMVFEVVLVDATECPIERPKKTTSLLLG